MARLFGHAGGHEGALVLEDVKVEPWQLVGSLDEGFKIALYGVSLGRFYNFARAVGQGRWALEKALDYPLARAATELHAAHLMGLNADQAIQAHGAMGLTNEVGLVHAWQDLRIFNIADGTNEILARTIAQRLFAGDIEL